MIINIKTHNNMETNRKRWSEEEISRLKQIMTRYTVDTEGCKYAAQELDRSYGATLQKWNSIKPKNIKSSVEEVKDILYKNISKNPGNLQEAFRITAEQTGRKTDSIMQGYYSKNSAYSRHKASTCFAMISKDRMASNAKNYDSSKMPKTTKQRIKLWIANILGIRKEDL